MGKDRYVMRWLHDGQIEELAFEGHAFHPVAPSPEGPIYFELVAHGASATMAFDPSTRRVAPAYLPDSVKASDSVSSPDGRWVVFESARNGPKQIWLRNVTSGTVELLTGGNCNSTSPAWELDSKAIIFASDCGRGIGLPALYRATVTGSPENSNLSSVRTSIPVFNGASGGTSVESRIHLDGVKSFGIEPEVVGRLHASRTEGAVPAGGRE
jgi:WD40-like Beta Propeller Repeat